jgi:hypothetical protein
LKNEKDGMMASLLDQDITSWEQLTGLWPKGQNSLFQNLARLKAAALSLSGAALELISRPGVSISLRFSLEPVPKGRKRPIFHLIDVAEFDGQLFLSVCFYADEMRDPEELGNLVPLGLFNEDGYCFDLDQDDPGLTAYILERQKDAHQSAVGGVPDAD